jgi:hypothetical protein
MANIVATTFKFEYVLVEMNSLVPFDFQLNQTPKRWFVMVLS